jgi:hypothetical protein
LPDIRSDAELSELALRGREPVFRAVAVRDEGVAETFVGLLKRVLVHLNDSADLNRKFNTSSEALLEEVCQRLRIPSVIAPETVLGGTP